METNPGRPLILSASRRTDLPGFHGESCAARLRKRIRGLRTRRLAGVVFWTRHPRPFLAGGPLHDLVTRELANPFVNLTVTGLGASPLEPGTPATNEVLELAPRLVDAFHGEPWRIRWRFDPLLAGITSLAAFRRIGRVMASLGVLSCTFSFPAYRSLKGDLTPQFERAGIPRWTRPAKIELLSKMADIAGGLGLTLESCSQPENLGLHPAIRPATCISGDLIERGDPSGLPLGLAFDRSQRTHCRCVTSEDIGDYETDRCLGGCVYCYSKAGGP